MSSLNDHALYNLSVEHAKTTYLPTWIALKKQIEL